MNQTQKQNRTKKLRLAAEKQGSASTMSRMTLDRNLNYPKLAAMAANKTPKVQRVGNYYTQTKNFVAGDGKGLGNVYFNTEPVYKARIRKLARPQGTFDVMKVIHKLLGLGTTKYANMVS